MNSSSSTQSLASKVLSQPVAPDSVHVWRGFRAPAKSFEEFSSFLGSVFLPSCSLLQPNAGLHAYLPALPRHQGKPATVPDQTALMFWTNQDAYHRAFETVAVRAYTNLHGDAYGPGSSAQFPVLLGNSLQSEQPYYLVDQPADWMLGQVQHLVGARPDALSVADFHSSIHSWAAALRESRPNGMEGGLLCAGDNYVVAWLLWERSAAPTTAMHDLTLIAEPWLDLAAVDYQIPVGLWEPWPGMDLKNPGCLNIQLSRPVPGDH